MIRIALSRLTASGRLVAKVEAALSEARPQTPSLKRRANKRRHNNKVLPQELKKSHSRLPYRHSPRVMPRLVATASLSTVVSAARAKTASLNTIKRRRGTGPPVLGVRAGVRVVTNSGEAKSRVELPAMLTATPPEWPVPEQTLHNSLKRSWQKSHNPMSISC